MSKKNKVFGVNNFRGSNRIKRKGRHTKSPNKSKSYKKYRGQGHG